MGDKLKIKSTKLDGIYIIEPNLYADERGIFGRVFCSDELEEIFEKHTIKQINHSTTYKKGSVRGLHFQYSPNCEIKLVKCIKGKIVDIVVDIRKNSPTFLQHLSIELSEENQQMIYISKGFAHGFQTLEDDTQLLYLHSSSYTPNNEGALNIEDSLLNIELPIKISDISEKDRDYKFLTKDFKGIEI